MSTPRPAGSESYFVIEFDVVKPDATVEHHYASTLTRGRHVQRAAWTSSSYLGGAARFDNYEAAQTEARLFLRSTKARNPRRRIRFVRIVQVLVATTLTTADTVFAPGLGLVDRVGALEAVE